MALSKKDTKRIDEIVKRSERDEAIKLAEQEVRQSADQNVHIKSHSTLDVEHEVYSSFIYQTVNIGDFTQIGPGVVFCGAINHATIEDPKAVANFSFAYHWKLPYFSYTHSRGPINIGNDVWIGRDVFILDGVTIGDGAIIGARAVIGKDVPPYAVVVGNPFVIKRYRYEPDQVEALLRIKWWDWPEKLIRERIEDFKDIDRFIEKYG